MSNNTEIESTKMSSSDDMKELKNVFLSFEKRIIAILLVFLLILCAGFFAITYTETRKTKEAFSESKDTVSKFRTTLNTVISDKSSEDSVKYAIDEDYYDEKVLKKYVSTISMVEESKIQYKHIESCFNKVFLHQKDKDTVNLILKDEETLIMECEKSWQLCVLDYAFMGTSDKRLTEKSKGFYISQNDEALEKVSYGTSNVKRSGCGLAALAMAINYTNGSQIVTLEEVLKWANDNDMYQENEGTKWALLTEYPPVKSYYSEEVVASSYEEFADILAEGKVIIASMSEGHFTDGGHFIVITSSNDGMLSVLDSASICRSLKEWDSYTVFEESNNHFWVISKDKPVEMEDTEEIEDTEEE